MKKIILTSAIIFGAVAVTFAQLPADAASTTLNVNLSPLQTIEVNNSVVNLNYSTKDHYKNGVTEKRDNHLTVYSTGGFEVRVKADTDAMTHGVATDGQKMETSKITVKASEGSTNVLGGSSYAGDVPLGANDKTLFSNRTGGVDKNFAVTYQGAGGDAFVNNYNNRGEGASVYTTTVTYSIVAK